MKTVHISEKQFSQTITPDKADIHPFAKHLCSLSDRIRLHYMGFDFTDDEVMYFDQNGYLHIPYGCPTIGHEIGHYVEMSNSKRWLLPDLGMKNYSIQEPPAKETFVGVAREIRVRMIDKMINDQVLGALGNNRTSQDVLFYNNCWANFVKKHLPFGKFQTFEQVKDWADSIVLQTMKHWSKDRIEHEWKIRLSFFDEHLSVRAAA